MDKNNSNPQDKAKLKPDPVKQGMDDGTFALVAKGLIKHANRSTDRMIKMDMSRMLQETARLRQAERIFMTTLGGIVQCSQKHGYPTKEKQQLTAWIDEVFEKMAELKKEIDNQKQIAQSYNEHVKLCRQKIALLEGKGDG